MASFDAYDKDKDGHKGYELDAGDYKLYVGKNAHDAWTDGEERLIASLDQDLSIDEDPVTGAEITSLFQTSTDEMEEELFPEATGRARGLQLRCGTQRKVK